MKFLKDLISNTEKSKKVSKMILNEKCSAAIIQEIPTKIEDLGGLTIPCEFGNSTKTNALADLGARVNLMSYSFYHKLNLQELEVHNNDHPDGK